MANKEVLKFGEEYVPTINDNAGSDFGNYETYSRNKIDSKIEGVAASAGGYSWDGKIVVFEGESITMNGTMKYPEYVAEQTGCKSVKIGIAGVPIMGNYPGETRDFRRRVSNIPANAEAIIILGDCNAIDTDQDNVYSTDPFKWAGRWNLAIDAIKCSFPTVPVLLVSEYPMKGKTAQNKNVPFQFERTATNYGCHFVNLSIESPLNLIYGYPVWGLTATDGVHSNHAAMPLFADVIIRHLRQIPPPVWQGVDTISIAESSVEVQTGKTVTLTVTKTGDLSTQWTSDNMDVACVMGGTVYGMSAGTATITATTRNGNMATCTVTVTEADG